MTQPALKSPNAVGPIRDRNARRVCGLTGITAGQDRLVSLRALRDGLELSLRELENQRRKDQIVTKALLVARFTKASCDAFLEMAATASTLILPKAAAEGAEAVANAYGTVAPLADAVGTRVAGGKVDVARTAIASAKKGVSLATRGQDVGVKLLAKSTVVKVEVINNAMNQDAKGVTKSAASYIRDLNTTAFKEAGFKKTAAVGEVTKIAQSAFTYNEQIGKAFDEMIQGSSESEERYQMLKTTILTQARQLSKRIAELELLIKSSADNVPAAGRQGPK
jgi:hypothetical protein